jgi:hypothetical protein
MHARDEGGDVDWLFFGLGSARLLPRLIADAALVFLSSLRPSPARAAAAGDICPLPGHAPVLPARRGAACRADRLDAASVPSLRAHAPRRGQRAATAADGQEPLPRLRTLQRYARPGPDAVAALTAAHDPARRR